MCDYCGGAEAPGEVAGEALGEALLEALLDALGEAQARRWRGAGERGGSGVPARLPLTRPRGCLEPASLSLAACLPRPWCCDGLVAAVMALLLPW